MSKEIKNQIENLREQIRHHDYAYYALSQPEISDKEYDGLMRKLKSLEDKYPVFKSDDSPTVRVSGVILEGFKTVRHKQKMLSLDNTYSLEELKEWDERVRKGLGTGQEVEYVVELKIDGVSANITYEKGRLSVGATRGDGETGEDVTQNIKTIRAIPLLMMGKDVLNFIEIRGEIYMERSDFEALNKEREKEGDVLFANPRNATSGSIKLLDTGAVAKRRLSFFAHSLGEYRGADIVSHWYFLSKLKEWGLRTNPHSRLCKNLEEVIFYCQSWQTKREKLNYDMDGMVIKVNSIAQQKRLGFTLKSPRWAAAYKFPARQATTEVLKINTNVGRTGVITPTAELKPIECAGVIISHATLHNFDEIKRLNIKVGDRVLIERAGEVIPKIVKVVKSQGNKVFKVPDACPVCKGKIVKEKEEDVAYRCINPSCPAQIERGLLHFASRDALDIEGMGEAVVEQLVQKGFIKDFADIYSLNKEKLLRLELFKDKKAENLLSAIERSKRQSLSRLIFGLGIRHIGEKAAYVLAQKFKALDNLIKAKLQDFDAIYEVGPVMAESILKFFRQNSTLRLIKKMKEAGLNLAEKEAILKKSILTGKTVVFTGELKGFSRKQAEDLVRGYGCNASSNVSKDTDFVIAGDNPGSKYDKAKKMGIKIINEDEFSRLIGF
ncbi:MAG: NAD-dependent DNA ligase LigA [Candidatus Omnitrophica bacterium]|nr:NAD-dependent DNA ligase LigA [Candidatus Omnitrophota bacterium]